MRTDAERRLILGGLAGAGHPGTLRLAQSQFEQCGGASRSGGVAVKQIVEAIKVRYPRLALEALQQLEARP